MHHQANPVNPINQGLDEELDNDWIRVINLM